MDKKQKWITKKSDLWTLPNLMGYFRILLIPVFAWLYLKAQTPGQYLAAAAVIGISGLTDLLDGKAARRFNMVTEFGKLLDPVADKATFGVILICMAVKQPWTVFLVVLFLLKEGFMAVMGILLLKKNGRKLDGAMWFGKVCTALLYVIIFIMMLWPGIPKSAAKGLVFLGAAVMAVTWCLYIPVFYRMWHKPVKQ